MGIKCPWAHKIPTILGCIRMRDSYLYSDEPESCISKVQTPKIVNHDRWESTFKIFNLQLDSKYIIASININDYIFMIISLIRENQQSTWEKPLISRIMNIKMEWFIMLTANTACLFAWVSLFTRGKAGSGRIPLCPQMSLFLHWQTSAWSGQYDGCFSGKTGRRQFLSKSRLLTNSRHRACSTRTPACEHLPIAHSADDTHHKTHIYTLNTHCAHNHNLPYTPKHQHRRS